MSPTEAAWLAGLYEGEGCLSRTVDNRNGNVGYALIIAMTDRDVIERLPVLTGTGNITTHVHDNPRWKPRHTWRTGRRSDIAAIIQAIRPYLGERRGADADAFLEWYNGPHPYATRLSRVS